ncbi:MAG: B12-binding domain-containing radical SAM protein [Candidatus Thorarchaeota archaeon]
MYNSCVELVIDNELPEHLVKSWNSGSYLYRRHAASLFFGSDKSTVKYPEFLDLLHETLSNEAFLTTNEQPDVVGFSIAASGLFSGLWLGREIKKIDPDIHLVIGGPLMNHSFAQTYMKRFPFIDSIIIGEGEYALGELLDHLYRNRDEVPDIPGVVARSKSDDYSYQQRQLIEDLDLIHYPDFTDFELSHYLGRGYGNRFFRPTLPIIASRGCSWARCSFCSDPFITPGHRIRSAEEVVQEMIAQSVKYKVFNFMFCDLALNGNPNLLKNLCDRLQELDYDFVWDCMLRPVSITKDLIANMAKAGCASIFIGIESMRSHIISNMQKGNTVQQNLQALKAAVDGNVFVTFNLMASYPGETVEDIIHTYEFLKANEEWLRGNVQIFISQYRITHGSPMYFNPERFNIIIGQTLYGESIPFNDRHSIPFYEYSVVELRNETDSERRNRIKHWKRIASLINEWNGSTIQFGFEDYFVDLGEFIVVSVAGNRFTHEKSVILSILRLLNNGPQSMESLLDCMGEYPSSSVEESVDILKGEEILIESDGKLSLTVRRFQNVHQRFRDKPNGDAR